MRQLIATAALAAFAAGCGGCFGSDGKKPEEGAGNVATDKAPATGAAPAEEAPPAEPTEADLRAERMTTALEAQGLGPQFHETLPTRLGNLDECRPEERRRFNLEGELVYVIVGTYPNAEAAQACIDAYAKLLGNLWNTYRDDFYRFDRFVIEVNPEMKQEQKDKAGAAVRNALGR